MTYYTIDELIDEAHREYLMRQKVYGNSVAQKRMNARLAARRIEVMGEIVQMLKKVKAGVPVEAEQEGSFY